MTKLKSKFKNIPRPYLITGIASLTLNMLALAVLATGYFVHKTGYLDYAIVNDGVERMCSEEFKQTVDASSKERGESNNDRGLRLALLDYPCAKNGADTYYTEGYEEYVRSLGLEP